MKMSRWFLSLALSVAATCAFAQDRADQPLREAMSDAVALVCTRISALGLSAPLRALTDDALVRDSPFFRLPLAPLEQIPTLIAECRHQLTLVHARLEASGVSVDVVFRIDTIRRMLLRVERLLPLLASNRGSER